MVKRIGEQSNRKLYKFIPFKYVKRIIETGKMPVKRIDGWEDCYENYFLKNKFVVGVNQYDLKKISRRFYGLCFSSLEESDALWRIYSDVRGYATGRADAEDNVAIRICVTPQQLYQLVPARADVSGSGYVKRVRYITKDTLEAELVADNPYSLNGLTDKIMDSFFTKRKEFEHEKEIRYLFITSRCHKSNSIELTLNPVAFFDEFTIDPRLTRNQYCNIRRKLEALGMAPAKINQSTLYKFDQKTLTINP